MAPNTEVLGLEKSSSHLSVTSKTQTHIKEGLFFICAIFTISTLDIHRATDFDQIEKFVHFFFFPSNLARELMMVSIPEQ